MSIKLYKVLSKNKHYNLNDVKKKKKEKETKEK